jgi:hypothetical protein
MPFCIACGKEIGADQKFCEYCGVAQNQPAAPLSPLSQSPPPPPPPAVTPPLVNSPHIAAKRKLPVKMNTTLIFGVVVVIAFIAGLSFIGFPLMKGTSSPGAAPGVTPPPEITTTVPTTIVPTTIPQTPALKRADQYEETYAEIYTSNRSYKFGEKEIFSHELTRPPLYIRFTITPGMVTREKLDDTGLNVTAVYVNPNAWFEVKVFDSATGTVVDRQGFNKDYSQITKQEFMIRTRGNYRIEMSGNDVSVFVQILTGD